MGKPSVEFNNRAWHERRETRPLDGSTLEPNLQTVEKMLADVERRTRTIEAAARVLVADARDADTFTALKEATTPVSSPMDEAAAREFVENLMGDE